MKSSFQYCRILNKSQSSQISFSESFVTTEISATESFPCSSSIFAISQAVLCFSQASSKSFINSQRIYLALKSLNFTSFCKTLNTGAGLSITTKLMLLHTPNRSSFVLAEGANLGGLGAEIEQ